MNATVFKHILIGVKHMPEAAPAVRYTGLLAKIFEAQVTLMTVVRWKKDRYTAERWMASARQMLPELEVDYRVSASMRPGLELLGELGKGDYDLLVLSAFEKSIFETMTTGSIARYVVSHINQPLLVVNGERQQINRLLVCTGGREIAQRVIEYGAFLARAAGASVTVMHVVSPVPSMYTGLDEIEESLDELLQTETPVAQHLRWCAHYLDEQGVTAEIKLCHGVVSNEILHEAFYHDHDLIIMGAHVFTSAWTELMLDNVTLQVVESASCPVLIV